MIPHICKLQPESLVSKVLDFDLWTERRSSLIVDAGIGDVRSHPTYFLPGSSIGSTNEQGNDATVCYSRIEA